MERRGQSLHTSALKLTSSNPRQSNSIIFCPFGGEVYTYAAGAALIVAVDSLYFFFFFLTAL